MSEKDAERAKLLMARKERKQTKRSLAMLENKNQEEGAIETHDSSAVNAQSPADTNGRQANAAAIN